MTAFTTDATTDATTASPDLDTPAYQALDLVSRIQALSCRITRQATSAASAYLPAVPGFPSEALYFPSAIVDKVFEVTEGALAERVPFARDVIHTQSVFIGDMFGAVQPIVDALSGNSVERPSV